MPTDPWLDAAWTVVQPHLPEPPAQVVEIGCGPLGGFVPMLLARGYAAIGVDPAAPEEPSYQQVEFEAAELPGRADAVIACTSLHHVADTATVVDRIEALLPEDGVLVVIEWDSARFDEATARWCFERLGSHGTHGWLQHLQDEWAESGADWKVFLTDWEARRGMHPAQALVELLDRRFDRRHFAEGPYFFSDLESTTAADEQDAIDRGLIRATRIDYVARRPS